MDVGILLVALAVLVFAVLAGRLGGTPVTMPMLFTALGLLLGEHVLGIVELGVDSEGVSVLAEVTLVLVLFTDASRIPLGAVVRQHLLAVRLLVVGMPLAMVLGALAGVLLFPELSLLSIALLAIVLAPTDAALGQSFVTNDAIPLRIRQALNVESGLNDGLALPFLLVVVDLAREEAEGWVHYALLFASMVGLGVLAGAVTGWAGGRLLQRSAARGWTTETTQRIGTLSLAAIAFALAESVGGNGFVAAFVAGLVVGSTARSLLEATSIFAEAEGQLLTLLTFLTFGAVVAGGVIADLTWEAAAYAVLSLVLVRPLATGTALVGTGVSAPTVAFLGWAGPRGLASIVYAVLVAESGGIEGAEQIFQVAAWTILLSVVLHGLSAAPLSRRYGAFVDASLPETAPERQEVSALPVRLPPHRGRAAEEQA